MKRPTERDLTTGTMAGHFRALAIPAALGMLFSTLYNVVDIFYAGMLSTEAQAGLAIGFQAFFIFMSIGFGLSQALSALVSNAKGAKQAGSARGLAAQGLTYGVIATVLMMGLAMAFGPSLITLVSEPGGYRDAATGYFYVLIFSLPGFLLAYAANGILTAHGDSLSMQRALMVAFLVNIGLNPLLMFTFGLGFNGIAIATVISQTGVMVWILYRVAQLEIFEDIKRADFVPDLSCFRAITVQLLPGSAALMVMFLSGFVVQYALKNFGETAIAAYGVGLRIEQILLLPVLGMTGALLPIAGQNFGGGHHDRVREALFFCWKLGFAMTVIATPTLWFGGAYFVSLFTDDPEVIAVGASYLKVDAILFPIYMMLFSINSILQALKQPVYTLWISLYRQGFGVAAFIWVFVGLMGFDVWGVWFGIATAVLSGWVIAMVVVERVARVHIGGLFNPQPVARAA
jgi:putative MATE family efflux protein